MDPNKRRIIDAAITKDFLSKNKQQVTALVQEFGKLIKDSVLAGSAHRFYLKGGNALNLLDNKQADGDYDFQLRPADALYANWAGEFPRLDAKILDALKATVANVAGTPPADLPPFNLVSFSVATLQGWAKNTKHPIYNAHIDLDKLARKKRRDDILHIGRAFRQNTYQQIVANPNYKNGRLEGKEIVGLTTEQFSEEAAKNFGPMIYVNYTIPGFILYRLVYSYNYSLDEDSFPLKSEIIDVSVPRPGSSEVLMSQEGVVTYFRKAPRDDGDRGFDFDIPGWGYHFYENINLLQEIELGVSGSPQKKDKREARLDTAMKALIQASPPLEEETRPFDRILQAPITEPHPAAADKKIQCYFNALAYNFFSYDNAYNLTAIDSLQQQATEKIKSHFIAMELFFRMHIEDWRKLVFFGLNDKCPQASKNTVQAAKNLFSQFLSPYISSITLPPHMVPEPLYNMICGTTFQYISPFSLLPEGAPFPCYYVVVEVTNLVFDKINKYYSTYYYKGRYRAYPPAGDPPAFSCVCTDKDITRGLYIVFQKCAALTKPCNEHVEEMLSRSILEYQRFSLAEAIHTARLRAAWPLSEARPPVCGDVLYGLPDLLNTLKSMENAKAQCKLADLFPHLPQYYADQPLTPENPEPQPAVGQNFLADLILTGLEGVQQVDAPDASVIEFEALAGKPAFMAQSVCGGAVKEGAKIKCRFDAVNTGDPQFSGTFLDLPGAAVSLSGLDFTLSAFTFSSGTNQPTWSPPAFAYTLTSANGLQFAARQAAGSRQWSIRSSDGGRPLSMKDMLAEFGLGDLDFNGLLPPEFGAQLFERLMLNSVEIEAEGDEARGIYFDVSSELPLTLPGDFISFTPGFNVSIQEPFGPRTAGFQAYGHLALGRTTYDIFVSPFSGDITLAMQKGDTLDLGAVCTRFFGVAILPDLQFDNLHASINYKNGAFMFALSARNVLTVSIARREISLERISVQVWRAASSFTVTVKGLLEICGGRFELTGTYAGEGRYGFGACITEGIYFNASDLLGYFLGNTCNLGDSFNFGILQLVLRCETGPSPSFDFAVRAAFCGNDDTLKKLFSASADLSVKGCKTGNEWDFSVCVACELALMGGHTLECRYDYGGAGERRNAVALACRPGTDGEALTLAAVLKAVGFEGLDEQWSFLSETALARIDLKYDFTEKKLSGQVWSAGRGTLNLSITLGKKTDYRLSLFSPAEFYLTDLPVAGGLIAPFLPCKDSLSVKDITIYALSSPDAESGFPAGVGLNLTLFGQKRQWRIYEPKAQAGGEPAPYVLAAQKSPPPKVTWIKLDKTVSILSLHRVGLGLDGHCLTLALDAALNVSPLTFRLYGAGVSVDLNDFGVEFLITGFGISYQSQSLSISGELNKTGSKYSGTLLARAGEFSAFAVAQYSEDGSLFAYGALSAKLGGPPALFITGLALGFGYNKRLALPEIDQVADFPLIKAAMGRLDGEGLLGELEQFLADEKGRNFLCAGIRFTSFEIADSFALLAVSFGNNVEVDLLGISDMTMPPHCAAGVAPMARAQLELKASFKPAEGFFGVEARLTSESYVLSKDCRLTGGFAFYMWFGGERAGDFVITLGGYHPAYALSKPEHYPDVPRVGFLWNIGTAVNISGELYFALTPGALMAGVRLSATYTLGNLKAYFLAKADFYIVWKPFHYDVEVGVTIGASYYVELWLVSFTISVELGADLHIWGPDFSGSARISLWVLSFNISFGANASPTAQPLDWEQFCRSFLPKADAANKNALQAGDSAAPAPLSISFGDGLNGQVSVGGKKVKAVSPRGLTLTASSVLPVHHAEVNGASIGDLTPPTVRVKPMGGAGARFSSRLTMRATRSGGDALPLQGKAVVKNLPTALWGGEGELLADVPCGIEAYVCGSHENEEVFPQTRWISLDDLYQKGATVIENAFAYGHPADLPAYMDSGSIAVYSATADSAAVAAARERLLDSLGVSLGEPIDLRLYAGQAENYFDEEPWLTVKAVNL